MKKIIVLSSGLILLLLIFNIILTKKYKEKKSENEFLIEDYTNLLDKEFRLSSIIKKQSIFQYTAETTVLLDIELRHAGNSNNIKLSSLLKDGKPRLFFRFRETDCDPCVQNSLKLIENAAAHIPNRDIAILSNYTNARQYYAYAGTQSLNVYNAGSLNISLEDQEQPYFFILTGNLKMQDIFIPVKEDGNYTSEYLNCMVQKYWADSQKEHNHHCQDAQCVNH